MMNSSFLLECNKRVKRGFVQNGWVTFFPSNAQSTVGQSLNREIIVLKLSAKIITAKIKTTCLHGIFMLIVYTFKAF